MYPESAWYRSFGVDCNTVILCLHPFSSWSGQVLIQGCFQQTGVASLQDLRVPHPGVHRFSGTQRAMCNVLASTPMQRKRSLLSSDQTDNPPTPTHRSTGQHILPETLTLKSSCCAVLCCGHRMHHPLRLQRQEKQMV